SRRIDATVSVASCLERKRRSTTMRTLHCLVFASPLVLVAALAAGCGSPEPTSGGGTTSGGAQAIALTASPGEADVLTCGTQQILATVTGADDTKVSWAIDGDATRGAIDTKGMYTAPIVRPSPNEVTITATAHADPTKSASSHLSLFTALPQAP